MTTLTHPFEIQASDSADTPDQIMLTWGNTPKGSVASIYLPAVEASDILSLADKLYVKHRLTATDAHTIEGPAGDVTFIPIPKGQGRYAGLLSVDLPNLAKPVSSYTVGVRQLTPASATIQPPPPPPPQPQIFSESTKAAPEPTTFSWLETRGAFQYTFTIKPKDVLLYPEERLFAWLQWRMGVTPPTSRWLPVLQRYLNLTRIRVINFGGDPNKIPPSQTGNVPGKGPEPICPPPICPPVKVENEFEVIGKVVAIHYDRFGDFSGFTVCNEEGCDQSFRVHEHAVEEIVRRAWMERSVVRVLVEKCDRNWPITISLLRYH
jgi:hypothetical protein